MFIQQLINFWKGDSELKSMFSEFDEMINISKDMFGKATGNLFNPSADMGPVSRELIKLDVRLNGLQQTIRKDIVVHITVKGTKDILPCLILMSLVKDAERLGDYAKNIMEIAERFTDFERGKYFESLKTMQKSILGWFDETKEAFDKVDAAHAQKIREDAYSCEKECDRLAWEMMTIKKQDAVALALLFRFFKRVTAHLGNICTSVVMPLDKLDYYEKPE